MGEDLGHVQAGGVSFVEHRGQGRPVALAGEAGVDPVGEGVPPARGVVVLRLQAGPHLAEAGVKRSGNRAAVRSTAARG